MFVPRISRGGIYVVALLFHLAAAKTYTKCELAIELRDWHSVPYEQIGILVCIAMQSNFNTETVNDGSYFGMYQISAEFWCDRSYAGKACGVQCKSLTDDDISDDISCVQAIFDEHQRLFGNGWNAWPFAEFCESQGNQFVQECFEEDNQIEKSYEPVVRKEKAPKREGEGKVYERCELARELHDQHNMQREEVAMWVCIAKHESSYNTSAIGRLNADGSEDHGLFQISDIYWCGVSGKACGMRCEDFRDNDISNDVRCIKQIYEEHTRISGDGFTAWAVYPRCKGQADQFIEGCLETDNDIPNEIMPFTPVPGIKQPTKTYVQVSNQRKVIDKSGEAGKVYERCELAQELRFKHKIPMEEVANWVCIAKHESSFNTSAIGRLNADGSEDHGLFQISDIYWCSPLGEVPGKGCNLPCSELEDSDISDDVECMLKIWDEHERLFGDGFQAWAVWPRCKGQSSSWIAGCFGENVSGESALLPAATQPHKTTTNEPVTTAQPTIATAQPTIATTNRAIRPPAISAKPIKTSVSPKTTTQAQKTIATTTQSITKPTTTLKPEAITSTIRRTSTIKPTTASTTKKALTTTPKLETTTAIDTTIKAVKLDKVSPTKPTTTQSDENSPTTVKSFNIFDLYFNSFPKGINVKPQPTKSESKTTTRAPIKITTTAIKPNGEITTPRKAFGNLTTEKNLKTPTATSGRTVSRTTTLKPTTTSQEAANTLSVSITKLPAKPSSTQTKRTMVTPFNVFDFYLKDYASKAPIVYRPVQFGDPKSSQLLTKSSATFYNNQIGRVVHSITPHSFDYLLRLTTPKNSLQSA